MKGVDKDRRIGRSGSKHEMPRQVDPSHRQSEPFGDRPVEDRKRDGDARLAVDHLVEVAVPGVVIILAIAMETFFDEQDPVDLTEHLVRFRSRRATVADPRCQASTFSRYGSGSRSG